MQCYCMTAYGLMKEDYHTWTTVDYDADVDDDLVKSYTTRINEGDSLCVKIEVVRRKLRSNGRKKKRHTYHKESHCRIVGCYFGYPEEIDENGVVHKRRQPARFPIKKLHRRFRMSSNVRTTLVCVPN